jgi:hypothetical protein
MTPQELRAMRRGDKVPVQQGPPMLGDGSQMSEQQMMMMEAAYNPMMQMGGSPDIRRVDRWLQYKVPNESDNGKFWVTETALAEELAKANLTKEEYNWFVREYAEMEAIAGGDGNEKWLASRQRKFMMRLEATRSRTDNKELGLRDGTLLLTQNIQQKSDVKMPTENQGNLNAGGFLGLWGRR